MVRRLLLFVGLLLMSVSTFAIKARPCPIFVEQEDGTTITIYLIGDEKFHFFITEDGIPIVQENTNRYCYAVSKDSLLASSGVVAHNKVQRNLEENIFVQTNFESNLLAIEHNIKRNQSKEALYPMDVHKSIMKTPLGYGKTYKGKKKGLVILVEFSDLDMSVTNPALAFDRFFNEKGYNENNHIGSVHDYFLTQSYGAFDLTFDVVGPVKISKNYAYYGANSTWNSKTDIRAGLFVNEACKLADEYVNYSDYDWDGDGTVEQVFLIYAGYGESSGASSNTIWPHKSNLYAWGKAGIGEGILHLDGVDVNDYACSCELAGTSGRTMNGIGTACHEFSHCLGIPDFYDVNYNGGFGMDSWDLMDSGGHNGPNRNGEIPSGYSAYERWFAGWLAFTELTETARIKNMPCIEDYPTAYKIYNDGNQDEFFILENRQNKGWFSYVNTSTDCHGLLVSHVDYAKIAWMTNAVNTAPLHQRMSVVPADNSYGYFYDGNDTKQYIPSNEDLEGDLFPGSKNIRELTNTSHINVGGKLFNKNVDGSFYLNKPITNIKEKEGLISFDFMGGIYVEPPQFLSTSILGRNSFEITWKKVASADSYIIEATEIREKSALGSLILSEDFHLFKSVDNSPDGVLDLSPQLNSYTCITGWKGNNIYTSTVGAKIGKEGFMGFIQTPSLVVKTNALTVKLSITANRKGMVYIEILDNNLNVFKTIGTECAEGENTILEHAEDMEPGAFCLRIRGELPFYLSKLLAFDGIVTAEAIDNMINIGYIIKPAETISMSGIKGTSYVFSDLSSSKYNVRIRAEKEEALSEWSDYILIDCNSSDKINETNLKKHTSHVFYNISGQHVHKMANKGIYIYETNGRYKKIVRNK